MCARWLIALSVTRCQEVSRPSPSYLTLHIFNMMDGLTCTNSRQSTSAILVEIPGSVCVLWRTQEYFLVLLPITVTVLLFSDVDRWLHIINVCDWCLSTWVFLSQSKLFSITQLVVYHIKLFFSRGRIKHVELLIFTSVHRAGSTRTKTLGTWSQTWMYKKSTWAFYKRFRPFVIDGVLILVIWCIN